MAWGLTRRDRGRTGGHPVRAAQPKGSTRRGKPDLIDAHLAVLAALQLNAGHLPTRRADGDREALQILRGAAVT
jgi:hypothetical protein